MSFGDTYEIDVRMVDGHMAVGSRRLEYQITKDTHRRIPENEAKLILAEMQRFAKKTRGIELDPTQAIWFSAYDRDFMLDKVQVNILLEGLKPPAGARFFGNFEEDPR